MNYESYQLKYTDFGEPTGRTKELRATKRTLWVHEGGNIGFQISSKYTGINRQAGKRYYRWVTEGSYTVHEGRNGFLIPLERRKNTYYGGHTAAYSWASNVDLLFAQIERGEVDIPLNVLHDIHDWNTRLKNPPLIELSGLDMNGFTRVRGAFNLLQEPDAASLTRRLFAPSRYRKDLVKAVSNSDIATVMLASAFRGLVPTDWLIKFMNDTEPLGLGETADFRHVRSMLKFLDPRSYRHLLNTPWTHNTAYAMSDLVNRREQGVIYDNLYAATTPPRVKTWGEFHDLGNYRRGVILRAENVRINGMQPAGPLPHFEMRERVWTPPEPVVIEPDEMAKRIAASFDGSRFEHVYPTDTETLKAWSDDMHNCISSYDQRAAKGATYLGGLLLNGKMVVNYEITPNGKMKQLLGRRNSVLDRATHDEIRSLLERGALIDFNDEYWGKPHRSARMDNFGAPIDNYAGGW